MFKYLWHSPTFTSWASTLTRTLGIVLILPLVLTRLSTEEIALWYLFATLMGLQLVIDMGFSATFSRVIAFAMGGAEEIKDLRQVIKTKQVKGANWNNVERIYATMGWVYIWLGCLWLLLLLLLGGWASAHLISKLSNPVEGWVALGMVIASSALRMYGAKYSSYLLGLNKVALLRRWETWIWMSMLAANMLVLYFGGGLLMLVFCTQGFIIIGVLVNRRLSLLAEKRFIQFLYHSKLDVKILSEIWPSVWRSGLGIFMSAGLVQGSGLVYARLASAEDVASYLLALNLIRVIAQFAQAPFYSKIPLLSRLRAEGKTKEQVSLAKRGMWLSYWVLIAGVIFVGVVGEYLIGIIDGNVNFVDQRLWALMGGAVFLERFGAMHIQLYSTTNHIVWHIANGLTGAIFLICVVPLYYILGVYAIPISQIISNLAFYDWYSARKSYHTFHLRVYDFELGTSLLPFMILLIYLIVVMQTG